MRTRRLAVLAAALGLLIGAWRLGVFQLLKDPAHVKALLLESGSLGFLVYVVAFAVLQPISPMPGVVFIVAASLVWPPPVAIALSMVGSTLAAVNGFWFARYLARDWVEQWIPDKLRKYDEHLATRGFLTVVALRLFFWTNQGLNFLFGLSRVGFTTHLVGTVVAFVPVVIALTYLGDAMMTVLLHQPMERWVAAAVVIVVAVGVRVVVVRARRVAGGVMPG